MNTLMIFRVAAITALAVVAVFAYEPLRGNILEKTPNYRLCNAVEDGDIGAVQRLLHQGASPNAYRDDRTFGHEARLTDAYVLDIAVESNNRAVVALLLKAGANPNSRNPQGITPLMWTRGDPQIIRLLLAHGADVNARDNEGKTVLNGGVLNPQAKRLLIGVGAHD